MIDEQKMPDVMSIYLERGEIKGLAYNGLVPTHHTCVRIPTDIDPADAVVVSGAILGERAVQEQMYLDRIATLTAERDNWHKLVIDHCEDDTEIRKIAKPFTDTEGDSYGVPTIVCIAEALAARIVELEARNEQVRELVEAVERMCLNDPDFREVDRIAAHLKEQDDE